MSSRINLGDLKSQMAKRVGPDRAQQYFGYLNRLLSRKLSKNEFNKLCALTLGRENLHMHNQLVRSVLKNACQPKVGPPSLAAKSLQPPVRSNGGVLPQSLQRSQSGVVGRRITDRPSPLRPNGRAEVRENGHLSSCDLKRLMQHHGGARPEQPAKKPRSAVNMSAALVEAIDGNADEQRRDVRVPLQAPLGIPFCRPSIGGARRNFGSYSASDEWWHIDDLRRRMERIAEREGLGGVAMDCANLLTNGLNVYLKRLISSCVELVGTRAGLGQMRQQTYKQQAHGNPINGVHLQSGGLPLEHRLITMQDFKVGMELNPQQLGEDWPLLLEKICHHSFEEKNRCFDTCEAKGLKPGLEYVGRTYWSFEEIASERSMLR